MRVDVESTGAELESTPPVLGSTSDQWGHTRVWREDPDHGGVSRWQARARRSSKVVKVGAKYGPQVWVATKALHGPAKEAAQKMMASERARKSAFDHAKSLSDGSILKVYEGDQSLWLVFSGDTAITVYPCRRRRCPASSRVRT